MQYADNIAGGFSFLFLTEAPLNIHSEREHIICINTEEDCDSVNYLEIDPKDNGPEMEFGFGLLLLMLHQASEGRPLCVRRSPLHYCDCIEH